MKKVISKIIALILSMALVLSSFSFAPISYAVTDTEGPKIDLDSIELSTKTITKLHESPTIKMMVTDETGVASVTVYYDVGEETNTPPASADLEYNEETGFWEGPIRYNTYDSELDAYIGFYGKYKLDQITAVDYYGNEVVLDGLDVPNGNFEMVGGNPDDKTPPIIDFENIVVDKTVEKGKSTVMTVPIEDESEIRVAYISYYTRNGGVAVGDLKEVSDGIYEVELYFDYPGEYQINYIELKDANNNYIEIRNCDSFLHDWAYDGYWDSSIPYMHHKALGFLNIQYGDPVPSDFTASIESMELSNGMVSRNSSVSDETFTVALESDTPLSSVEVNYGYERTGTGATSYASKIDDNTYEISVPAYYYGQWELVFITVIDIYGNRKTFYDPERMPYTDTFTDYAAAGVEMDFECGDYDYYVGIIDEDTGLGVSDAKFDDTTELLVDEGSLNGDLYEEMVEEDSLGVALYDVDVEGARDDETAVSFVAPEGFIDGDEVTVVHRRHNGTKEHFKAHVKHGRITIETDEFSPFLVQIDADHEHRYTVKEAVPATCTKDGNIKHYICDLCKGHFLDAEGKTVTTAEDVVIKATGQHDEEPVAAVASTYLKTGLTEGTHCKTCKTPIVKQKTVAKKPYPAPTLKYSDGMVEVKWTSAGAAKEVSYYKVLRAKYNSSGKVGTYNSIEKIVGASNCYYEDYDVQEAAKYSYKVAAYNKKGKKVIESAAKAINIPLLAPGFENIVHDAATGYPVIYIWTSDKAKRCDIYRSKTKNGTYSKIGSTTGDKYVDKKALSGTTYYYKLKAIYNDNSTYNSKFSGYKSGKKVKAETKLAKAIKDTVNSKGKIVNVITLEKALKAASKNGISYLAGFAGARETLDSGSIKKAGGSVYFTGMGFGDPYFSNEVAVVKKNGISYNRVDVATYGVNVLKVAKGSTKSEITSLINSTANKYFSASSWKVSSSKYSPSTTKYSAAVKEMKGVHNTYVKKAGYSKYASNIYYLKITNKKNSKKNGWTFVTVVPTLSRLSKPVIKVANITGSDMKVSWKKVSGANKYEVWKKVGSKGTYKKVKTTTSTSFKDKSTVKGKKYYYKVKAIKTANSTQNSYYSATKSLTCK